MKLVMSRILLLSSCSAALLSTGCQMYRAPGNLLPSLAASRQDRTIEEYAANSQFPSPSDVGLISDEE